MSKPAAAAAAPDDEAGYPSARVGWWSVGVLTFLYAISLMDRQVLNLLVDPVKQALGVNDFQIALLSGFAFALFYAVFGVLFGWMVDRFQRRGLIQAGLVVWSAATMACGLARSFGQLAVARFAVGGGEAALNPAAYSMIADTIPRRRLSTAIGVFGTGAMIGGLFSYVGGALVLKLIPAEGLTLPLLGHLEAWRVVFLAIGLPGILLAFVAWTIPEPARRQRLGVERPSYGAAVRFMARRWRFYGFFFAGAGLIAATNYGFGNWLPAFFMRTYHLAPEQAGFLLGPLAVVPQAVGLLSTGMIADRWFARGRTDIHLRLLILLAFCKAALVTAAMVTPIGLVPAAGLLAGATLFSAIVGLAPAVLQFVTPNEFRGQVSATYLFMYTFFGQAVGPTLVGAMTTFVFRDPGRIGPAVAATFLLLTPFAVLCLWAALKAAREAAAEAEAWEVDMKAVTALRPGGLEVLDYGEREDPVAGPGEVVVELKAAALNHADLMLREGRLGPLPLIPGHDGAGVVAALGAGVDRALLGRRVLLNPVASCGACRACVAGDPGSCPSRKALGQQLDGTYAEYVKVPAANALEIADEVGFEAAAAVPSAYFTAWQMLVERAGVRPGETVAVAGAGGGVGAAAVQIARLLGATPIALASSAEKLACARAMGAEHLVNHASEPVAERLRELTGGEGCDVIVDTVGAGQWPAFTEAIGRRGRIVLASSTTGDRIAIDIRQMIRQRLSILGSGPQGSHAVAAAVVRLLNQGKLKAPIDRTYPLRLAAEAQKRLEDRAAVGKVLLRP